jgi:very-short-patch-repair endonuclease
MPASPLFTRRELRAVGWSDSALDRAVRSGRIHRLRRDQFTTADRSVDPGLIAAAAARACTGAVVSHRSAALVHGLPLLQPPPRPELTVPPRSTGDVAGALLHRATLRRDDLAEVAGVPLTAIARTLVDIGRSTSTSAAVVTMDAALNRGLTDIAAIEKVLCACWNWPGIRRAVRAVDRADGRSESPLESISRLVIGWLGLPAPQLQTPLHDDRGLFIGRADFYWPESGVVGEADGQTKYDTRAVLLEEKRRQESLESLGLIVVRWDWTDVTRRANLLRERIRSAFDRGDRRDRSGFPRGWSVRVS